MSEESRSVPKVTMSNASGTSYECFELFVANGYWQAKTAWAMLRDDVSINHGWTLNKKERETGLRLDELSLASLDASGYSLGLVDAVVELLDRSPATPACHVSIDANLVDEDLAAKLTSWYRRRCGHSEGLLEIFRQVSPQGRRPSIYPSFAAGEGSFTIHIDVPENAFEMSQQELDQACRAEELATMWWAIPNGVTHATGVIVGGRVWLLPVGPTPEVAQLGSFVFDREVPYPPALLPSGVTFDYRLESDGSRSMGIAQGAGDGPQLRIEFVQADRRVPGTVRLAVEPA